MTGNSLIGIFSSKNSPSFSFRILDQQLLTNELRYCYDSTKCFYLSTVYILIFSKGFKNQNFRLKISLKMYKGITLFLLCSIFAQSQILTFSEIPITSNNASSNLRAENDSSLNDSDKNINETINQFNEAAGSENFVECQSMNCSRHWVLALDKSGSMRGPKWEKLKSAAGIIAEYLGTLKFQFLSIIEFNSVAEQPTMEHINPNEFDHQQLGLAGGGTSFKYPLLRAIEVISRWKNQHTCFVMLTDGLAAYPSEQLQIFSSFKKEIQEAGYDFCVICYFVKEVGGSDAPQSFVKMCNFLNGDFQEIKAEKLDVEFSANVKHQALAKNIQLIK